MREHKLRRRPRPHAATDTQNCAAAGERACCGALPAMQTTPRGRLLGVRGRPASLPACSVWPARPPDRSHKTAPAPDSNGLGWGNQGEWVVRAATETWCGAHVCGKSLCPSLLVWFGSEGFGSGWQAFPPDQPGPAVAQKHHLNMSSPSAHLAGLLAHCAGKHLHRHVGRELQAVHGRKHVFVWGREREEGR